MNKKLLTAAIGAALVAGPMLTAQAAGPTVYGKINIGVASLNNGNTTDNKSTVVTDDASRLGVKGDESLGRGLKAIYLIEMPVDADQGGFTTGATCTTSATVSCATTGRDVFAGLQGGWGTVRLGQFNTAYKNLSTGLEVFGDTIGDFTHSTFQGETRTANTIAYTSPSFNGLSFALESSRGETGTSTEANPLVAVIGYTGGPLYLGYGRVDLDVTGPAAGASTSYQKFVAQYAIGGAKLFGVWDDLNTETGSADSKTNHYGASYTMGNNTFALTYTKYDATGTNVDATQTSVGWIHALSKSTALKAVYTKLDNEASATRVGRIIGATTSSSGALAATTDGNDPSGIQLQLSVSF